MSTPASTPGLTAIGRRELAQRLTDPTLRVVDARPLAAFDGWRLAGERRGGHVPGAVALPAGWLRRLDDDDVRRILGAHGIDGTTTAVVVDADGDDATDAGLVAARLADLGIGDVRRLEGGWRAWSADDALPVDRLPNYRHLVSPAWLRAVLAGERPEAAPEGRVVVAHVNFGVPEEYAEAHIPGALYLDTNWLEDPVDWNRRSPAELETALRSLGIAADTTVVLYGRDTEGEANEKWPGRRAGQIAATRAALILRYAGVDDVRLLDGGYDWWVREGNPVETVDRQPVPVD
jgi:molybdopterin synthase sulfurtransferase